MDFTFLFTLFKSQFLPPAHSWSEAAGILLSTNILLVPQIKIGYSYASTRRVSPQ